MIGTSSLLALALTAVLGYRFWRSYRQNKHFALHPARRKTPSVTQIVMLLGILSYAITVQFPGNSMESWFDVHAEQIPDSRNTPDGGASLKEFGSSHPALNRQAAQQQPPSTAKEGSEAFSPPGNTNQPDITQPVAPLSSQPLKNDDSVHSEPLEPAPHSANSAQTAQYPVSGALIPREDSGSAVPGLAAVLVLGLIVVFGYRLWRSRNPSQSNLPVTKPARRKTPTVTQVVILLAILSFAVAAQFPDNGIGSWFDVHVEKTLNSRTSADRNAGLKELPAPSIALDEKTAPQTAPSTTPEDSGAFSLPTNVNQSDKPATDEQPAQQTAPVTAKEDSGAFSLPTNINQSDKPAADERPAQQTAPVIAQEDSGIFHSSTLLSLIGVLALGLAGVFGYRFWRSRNKLGSNLHAPKLTPRKASSFALVAASLCLLAYAVMVQFFGKGIEEKPLDSTLSNSLKELTPAPAINEQVAQEAAPLTLANKEEGSAPARDDTGQTPGKPVAGKKVIPGTTPLTPRENAIAISPADSIRMPGKLVAEKQIEKEAIPVTAREDSTVLSSASNTAYIPDTPAGDVPQQAVYKAQPAYPARQRRGPSGRYAFNGSIGAQSENSKFSDDNRKQKRRQFRTNVDLNNRGFIYDPRLVTYDAGIRLERNTSTSTDSDASSRAVLKMLGYHIHTDWFTKKPYAVTLYGNRNQSTVSTYQAPSYSQTNTGMGARWSWDNRWAGRMRFHLDRMQADSDSASSPRLDKSQSFGVDSSLKLRPKQWGESEVSYGLKHSEMNEQIAGSNQSQNYMYISDSSTLGNKMNLRANLSYSNQRNQDGYSNLGATTNNFFNFNSGLSVKHSEKLSNSYNASLSTYETGTNKTTNQLVSASSGYKLSPQWHTNGSLALNSSKSESIGNPSQTNSSAYGNGGVNYSNQFGVYLVNSGYNLALSRSVSSQANTPTQLNAMQSANVGYSRTGSPRYADSLQLRMSQATGTGSKSNELNAHYGVNSLWSRNDTLQGSVDYRHNTQSYTSLLGDSYSNNTTNISTNGGWQHRFSDIANMTLSLSANQTTSGEMKNNSSSAQISAAMLLRSNLQLNALARMETYSGSTSYSGNKFTVESNLNYRIGKWITGARYRYSDAQLQLSPFKEQSIFLTVTRTYGFSF